MAEPRVIVVGDHHSIQLIKSAIGFAGFMAVVEFVEKPQDASEIMGVAAPRFSSDMLAELKKLQIPCEEPMDDDTRNILDGIAQLRAWMENRINQWLARQVIQPALAAHPAALLVTASLEKLDVRHSVWEIQSGGDPCTARSSR